MKTQYTKDNPRFVWNIGAIAEQFPDMPEQGAGVVLWDRQERKPVMTLHREYVQAICLELKGESGPEGLEAWFNSLPNDALKSEGIKPTL